MTLVRKEMAGELFTVFLFLRNFLELRVFSQDRDRPRYDDNRSSGYGNNNDRGVFGNKGGGYGGYRSMESDQNPRGNDQSSSSGAPIDWGALNQAAVSF